MKVYFLIESEQESAEREAVTDCELYRGMTGQVETTDIFRIPIRTDRRPRNAENADQIIFNAFFEMEHGIKDIRSRAMFCTNSFNDAKPYAGGEGEGSVVKVYPLKSAKIAFKPGSPDSLSLLDDLGHSFKSILRSMFNIQHPKRANVSRLIHQLNNGAVTNCLQQVNAVVTELKELADGDEKMLRIIQSGLERCRNFVQPYRVISATQVAEALPNSNGVELMIFDAPYFYAQLASTVDATDYDFDAEDFPF